MATEEVVFRGACKSAKFWAEDAVKTEVPI